MVRCLFLFCLLDDLVLGFCYSNLTREANGFELALTYHRCVTSEPTNQVCQSPQVLSLQDIYNGFQAGDAFCLPSVFLEQSRTAPEQHQKVKITRIRKMNQKDVSVLTELNNITNSKKLKLMRNIFIPGSPFKLLENVRHLKYNYWVEVCTQICSFPNKNAACCLCCFLYSDKSSSRKLGAYPTSQATFSPGIIYLLEDLQTQMPLAKKFKRNYDYVF